MRVDQSRSLIATQKFQGSEILYSYYWFTRCCFFQYKPKKFERKIPDTANLVNKATLSLKDTEVDDEVANIIDLPPKLLSIKELQRLKKNPDTSSFITTREFNRLTKISLDVRITEEAKNLVN